MANRGGFPGGGAYMQQLLKQAQKMQEESEKIQEELAETEVFATAGGGMVKVTMSGALEMTDLNIKPEAVDPDDIELLEDMIIAAYNEALARAQKLKEEKMGALTGGMGGLF